MAFLDRYKFLVEQVEKAVVILVFFLPLRQLCFRSFHHGQEALFAIAAQFSAESKGGRCLAETETAKTIVLRPRGLLGV